MSTTLRATTLHCDRETLARLEQLQALHHGAAKSRIVADLVKEALDKALTLPPLDLTAAS